MRSTALRRETTPRWVLVPVALGLALSGCLASATDAATESCAGLERTGATVTVVAALSEADVTVLTQALEGFTQCTGAVVEVRPIDEQEPGERVEALRDGGTAVNLAVVQGRDALDDLATEGVAQGFEEPMQKRVAEFFPGAWLSYGSVQSKLRGVPVRVSMESLLWVAPDVLEAEGGFPTSWPQLLEIADRFTGRTGKSAACLPDDAPRLGRAVLLDWFEEAALHLNATDTEPQSYDALFSEAIPLDGAAGEDAAQALRRLVGPAGTPGAEQADEAGLVSALAAGECAFLLADQQLVERVPRAAEGDVRAAPVPDGKRLRVTSAFAAAVDEEPETQLLLHYLTTEDFATRAFEAGSWVTGSNSGVPAARPVSGGDPVVLARSLLTRRDRTFRWDGSQVLPEPEDGERFAAALAEWRGGQGLTASLEEVEQS